MKVAVVSDDGRTISPHFGRAQYYLVYELLDGRVLGKETRPKTAHHHQGEADLRPAVAGGVCDLPSHHGDTGAEATLHRDMLSGVADCEALIGRGMGRGMYESIRESNIRPYLTNIAVADDAVQAYVDGTLDCHTERLH